LCAWFYLRSRLMSVIICLALRSSGQLGALWRSLCSDLYVFNFFTSNCSVDSDLLADVYFYNFPEDRRALKVLGEYLHSLGISFRDDKPQLAYFVFLVETVQTALTGADAHYWFIQGFGNVEKLKDSHYAPIDIPIIDSIISLVVQEYFCYRIWTLNRRWSWFCAATAIVRIFLILSPSRPS
jgi:hypothetical protein